MKSILFDQIEHPYFSYEEVKKEEILYADLQCGEELPEAVFSDYLDAIEEPDLQDFIQHQRDQFEKAKQAGAIDARWQNLNHCTSEAAGAVAEGNTARIAITFCELGRAIEEMNHPTREHLMDSHELLVDETFRKTLRERELSRKAKTFREAKKIIQREANEIWRNDTGKESRTGYVAKILHEDVERLTGTQYAKTTVAKWVREVAPDYASLPGAEKKS